MGVKFFTNVAGPGIGPIIPEPLHSVGVGGYSKRFAAERLTVGAFTSWQSAGTDPLPLVVGGASIGTVSVAEESGLRFVRLDNGASGATSITDGSASTLPYTIALVVRKTNSADYWTEYGGSRLHRAANASMRIDGGTTGNVAASGFSAAAWHCLIAVSDPTAPAVRVDGTESTTVNSGPFVASKSQFKALTFYSVGGGTDSLLDLAEVVVWPTVLDATQRVGVRTALKARYSVLP